MNEIEQYSSKFVSFWGSGSGIPEVFDIDSRKAIAVLLALEGPLTAKQISNKLNISPTTVSAHIRKLLDAHVVKEVRYPEKKYKQEKYYALAIPAYTVKEFNELVELSRDFSEIVAEAAKSAYLKVLERAEDWFSKTIMAKQGYKLDDHEIRWLLWIDGIMYTTQEKLHEINLLKLPWKTKRRHYAYLLIKD